MIPGRVLIVQHGEKQRRAGDPGLTARGLAQARTAGRWLAARERVDALWASPMRRAIETAAAITAEVGVEASEDVRLRERVNWEGNEALDEFLERWQRTSGDRSWVPPGEDSSRAAAARFLAALEDIVGATSGPGVAVIVAHGGVTTDVLRDLLGDTELVRRAPGIIEEGVPGGAITTIERLDTGWEVRSVAVQP
jgi:broad specificity phosphatase PhoE